MLRKLSSMFFLLCEPFPLFTLNLPFSRFRKCLLVPFKFPKSREKCLLFFLIFIYLFILFMAVLGLRFCAWAFSSCGERGPLFIAVHGPLTVAASLVAEHRLQTRRLSSCGSWA